MADFVGPFPLSVTLTGKSGVAPALRLVDAAPGLRCGVSDSKKAKRIFAASDCREWNHSSVAYQTNYLFRSSNHALSFDKIAVHRLLVVYE